MSNTLNGSSPFPGNSWNIYNSVNVVGPLNNKMVIYGNASPSALNLGTNIDASGNLYSNGNLKLPFGTTANRPIPDQGFFRFNTSQTLIEYYNGNTWLNIVNSLTPTTPPTITITNPNGVATTYTWNSSFATYTFSFVNANFSTYTITATGPCTGLFTLNGGGGGGGNENGVTPSAGANGGKTIGTFVMTPGNTYYLLVGQGGTSVLPNTTNTNVPIGGGGLTGPLGFAGQGGGFTGLFLGPIILGSATTTSVTAGNNSNAIMMAGGGGGGAAESGGTTIGGQGGGIVGGNAAPQSAPGTQLGGGGAIWNGIGTTGGAGGLAYGQPLPGNPGPGSLAGVQMQGGIPANSGDLGGGGGGGGGYYGGGGGTGQNTPSGTGGGGGASFFSTAVESPLTLTGTGAAGGAGYTNGTNGSATLAFVN